MINNKLLSGILALILVAGLGTPAFANVDDYGEITDPSGIDFGAATEVEEISIPAAVVDLISNGDFETGDFTDWTQFTTANGATNPAIAVFDTDGDTVATNSAQFRVGDTNLPIGPQEGGGIFQTITTAGGIITITADIASNSPSFANSDGGTFSLFFNGVLVDSHAFGEIDAATTERATLSAVVLGVPAGDHEVRIEMTRVFLQGSGTPSQYIDNVIAFGEQAVGGNFLPIDSAALLIAGMSANLSLIVPIAAGIAGTGFYLIKFRTAKE